MWIDSHCHLDAPEFNADRDEVIERARIAGVTQMVIPAVTPSHFEVVAHLAQKENFFYALGIHPMWMDGVSISTSTEKLVIAPPRIQQDQQVIDRLRQSLERFQGDQRLVAIGEIGLDYYIPELDRQRQWFFYTEQLKLAREFNLPVILHVRKSADMLLKGLRQYKVLGGIAHAFNGSDQQAHAFIDLGLNLGFGGACTFEGAKQIRHLAQSLPLESLVLETDSPDMPPYWLYRTVKQRQVMGQQGRNEPAVLPQIAAKIAQLRAMPINELARAVYTNTLQALPKMQSLVAG